MRTAGCPPAGVGFSAVTLGLSAVSLLRGCACGLPAAIEVGPLWGPFSFAVPDRRFAFGSPAVIDGSTPMGSPAPRCALGRGGHFTLAADVFLPCAGLFDCPQPGFLTRRIDYFRTTAPSLANTRKSETPHFQTHPCEAAPQGRPKRGKTTLYGTNRPPKSTRKWPWIENSMGWIGRSMGWKRKSMGWMAAGAPPRRLSNAKTQTTVGVRFNGLPYSAQGRTTCTLPPARRGGYPASRRNGHHAPQTTQRGRRPHRGRTFYNRG